MNFSDSYYSVSVTKNGIITNTVFNNTSHDIRLRREEAVYYFFKSKKEIELDKNIETYQIDFFIWSHSISHDYDYGTYIEFDRIDELNLFTVKDRKVSINYFFWAIEAQRANQYKSDLFINNEVCITDEYDGKEYLVYDNNICLQLGIDFKYR